MSISIDELKEIVSLIEIKDGSKPTFEDYVDWKIDNGTLSVQNLKLEIKNCGLLWEKAGFGDSNWNVVYDDIINSVTKLVTETSVFKRDDFNNQKQNTPIKTDRFTTSFYQRLDISDYVIFVENLNQQEVLKYIKSNYDKIQEIFNKKHKRFILLSEIISHADALNTLKYYYPKLSIEEKLEKLNFETIKNYIGYEGHITNGLLSIDYHSEFIQFEDDSVGAFIELCTEFLSEIKKAHDSDDLPYLPEGDFDIKIDAETEQALSIIYEQFQALKDNGSFLQVLPILEKYTKFDKEESLDNLSKLQVDEDFNIHLTDYNLEIKLSHLTKSIYLLYINHPEGILLSALNDYKLELLKYYKLISNRVDLDKMNESVADLLDPTSNAIYVHLSRIKSAFTKVIHPSLAKHYFIDGAKNKPKKIKLNESLIVLNNTRELK